MATYSIPTLDDVMEMEDLEVTVVDLENPSENNDWPGTYANEAVLGLDGDDTLEGDDGDGQDTDDPSHDFINGNMGDDVINGGQGDDTLRGGMGNDNIDGGAGADMIGGDLGDDTLMGGAGADLIIGGDGHDRILGGAGNDTLIGDMPGHEYVGHDYIDGGGGADLIIGKDGNDFLYGDGDSTVTGADTIYGYGGDDHIDAGGKADSVNGNQGDDTIMGGAGADMLRGGRDEDEVHGGAGNDVIHGDRGADVLHGDGGADTVYGDNDTMSDDHQGDSIVGGTEANWDDIEDKSGLIDLLKSGKIVYGDKLYGGAGKDTIHAGDENDQDGFQDNTFTFTYPSGGNVEVKFIHGNLLDGGAGNDVLMGAAGQDTLMGGTGDDELTGGDGTDMLMGDAGDDELSDVGGTDGKNLLEGGADDDVLTASFRSAVGKGGAAALDPTGVVAAAAADVDVADADTLMGGSGDDMLVVAATALDVAAQQATALNDVLGAFGLDEEGHASAGLVLEGGTGNDTFDLSDLTGVTLSTYRTFIEITDFDIGSDRVLLTDTGGTVISTLHDAIEAQLNLTTDTTDDPALRDADEYGTAAVGEVWQDGDDSYVHLTDEIVVKFVGLTAEQLASGEDSQIFFAASA